MGTYEKTTAPNASVGADAGQPSFKNNNGIVSDSYTECNLSDEKMEAICRKMQRIIMEQTVRDKLYAAIMELPEKQAQEDLRPFLPWHEQGRNRSARRC